jgi:hypothetical protein
MTCGHFYSGYLESHSDLNTGANLILNWAIPVAVTLAALKYTTRLTTDTEKGSATRSSVTG